MDRNSTVNSLQRKKEDSEYMKKKKDRFTERGNDSY